MAEDYTLDAPIVPPAPVPTTKYKIRSMTFDQESFATPTQPGAEPVPGLITVKLRDNNGAVLFCTYEGAKATNIMKQMNTADMSVKSLNRRMMEQLEKDGKLPPGDITGTPDAPEAE